jgi:two-component system LytT family response regulator
MFKSIIIEDEINAANLLEGMLHEIDPSIRILEKCRDLPTGVKSIRRNKPDVVFLDIELPIYDGTQLLDFFDKEEIDFHLIFTTAYDQYAIKAFEMSAIDYLQKPIGEEKLRIAIEKLAGKSAKTAAGLLPVFSENFRSPVGGKIVVPVSDGFEIMNMKDIAYLKAEGSYTQIVLSANKSLVVSKNLKYFQNILSGTGYFVRIHRSFIANMNYAKKILRKDGDFLILENNAELPVSEDKVDMILHRLGRP